MTTRTERRCVLCQQSVDSDSVASVPKTPTAHCAVFVDKQQTIFTEIWAWFSVAKNSPLQSLCGLEIDGVPHRAIATDLAGALKLAPFIEQASRKTGEKFELVRFVKAETPVRL